jgi:hypothetical protein
MNKPKTNMKYSLLVSEGTYQNYNWRGVREQYIGSDIEPILLGTKTDGHVAEGYEDKSNYYLIIQGNNKYIIEIGEEYQGNMTIYDYVVHQLPEMKDVVFNTVIDKEKECK